MAIADRAETAAPDWLPIETTTGSFYLADGDFQLALLHLKRSLDLNIKLNGTRQPAGPEPTVSAAAELAATAPSATPPDAIASLELSLEPDLLEDAPAA